MAVDKSIKIAAVEKGGVGSERVVHLRFSGAQARDLQFEKIDGHKTMVIHGEDTLEALKNAFATLGEAPPEESADSAAGDPAPDAVEPQKDELPF